MLVGCAMGWCAPDAWHRFSALRELSRSKVPGSAWVEVVPVLASRRQVASTERQTCSAHPAGGAPRLRVSGHVISSWGLPCVILRLSLHVIVMRLQKCVLLRSQTSPPVHVWDLLCELLPGIR